jgi:hypothetical protein
MPESSAHVARVRAVHPVEHRCSRVSGVLLLLTIGFVAIAVVLSPARLAPYFPPQAARLNDLLLEGLRLARLLFLGGAALAFVSAVVQRYWPAEDDSVIGAAPHTRDYVVAGLLVATALCLRVPHISDSFWFDELGSEMRVVQRGLPVILAFSADGNNHVGNSLAMWMASRFGTEEWVLRLPSLLIGIVLPAGMYLLLQRLTTRRVALIAAMLVVIQFRMVDFSAEARGYIGHIAFSALASVVFGVISQKWNWRWAALYLVTATLSIWFVITGAYLVFAHALLAAGLLVYEWVRTKQPLATFTRTTEFRRYLWCGTVCGWALFCGLLLHVLTLPQLMEYSRNYAPSFHSPLDLKFYANALPYLAGVEHHTVAAVLLLAAVVGYCVSHRDWRAWAAIAGGPVFLVVAFQISGNVASPRLFVSLIFPLLIGLSFFIEGLWRQKRLVARAAAAIVAVLLVADSEPVFARYYSVGNPGLGELARQIPSNEVFLANVQAGSNVYYFPKSEWEADKRLVVSRLQAMPSPPTYVLWGDDCRRESEAALAPLGYQKVSVLNDWTFAEYASNQRRPCFVLYERHR